MGITITGKTKAPQAQKLLAKIASYRFEQQYGELRGHDNVDKALAAAAKALTKLM